MASLAQVSKSRIAVNWTIHGGGTDGYYYRKTSEGKSVQDDFIRMKDLFDHVNDELAKNCKEGRRITSIKNFRWTSPGASIVSNEDIDDQFRGIFEHPYWEEVYGNRSMETRDKLGRDRLHQPVTSGVGAPEDAETWGPGELLKDLQLSMFDQDKYDALTDEEEKKKYVSDNVFTNELLSTEYANKYTQMTSGDFGLWFQRYVESESQDGSFSPFKRAFPSEWTNEEDQGKLKKDLQKLHDDIFNVAQKENQILKDEKMSDIITQIILASCKRVTDDAEWEKSCQHWEFYPITCSPINGVEGRKELFKQYPQKDVTDKGKERLEEIRSKAEAAKAEAMEKGDTEKVARLNQKIVEIANAENELDVVGAEMKYKRYNGNPALQFIYLLNIARRCLVFHKGKKVREEYVTSAPEKTVANMPSINPHDFKFDATYDCMDPDERKQMYMDINGFLQNVRPNKTRHETSDLFAFNHVDVEGTIYNLFENDNLIKLLMQLQGGVKLDERDFYTKIEEDWVGGVLDEIVAEVHEKHPDKDNISDVPIILKLLYYVMFNSSNTKDGIAKEYVVGSPEKTLKRKTTGEDQAVSVNPGKFLPGWWDNYDFMAPVHGFLRSVSKALYYKVTGNSGGGRMAAGTRRQLESTMHGKKPLTERPNKTDGGTVVPYHEWQDPDRVLKFLEPACEFKRPFYDEIRYTMLDIAKEYAGTKNHTDTKNEDETAWEATGTTPEAIKERFKGEVRTNLRGKRYAEADEANGEYFSDDFERHFKKFVKIEGSNFGSTEGANTNPFVKIFINPGRSEYKNSFTMAQGGKKKRKKRTRRKRKKKRKRTRKKRKKKRKCKKRMKKKIICLSAPNKKATRKLIRVTKKLAKMKGIRLSKCSKQRIKKWAKKKKRTRRRRKR